MKEIDQFVGLHRTGEINDHQLVQAILNLFEEDLHTRAMGIDVPPLEPWVKKLQRDLDDARDVWLAEQRKLMLPGVMTWGSGKPSYALAIGPGIGCAIFGLMTLGNLAGGALERPNGWRMVGFSAGLSFVALVVCIWMAVKADLWRRGQREYDVKRTRIILRDCQDRYGPAKAG